jgi:hypothetical protein
MRRERWLPILFIALPVFLLIVFRTGSSVPERWRNLFHLGAAIVVATIVFVVPIRTALRAERKAGLAPRSRGFSAKLAVAAEALRATAAELDEDPDSGYGRELDAYLRELRRVAKEQDGHDLLAGFSLANANAARMRKAADELDAYAGRVRGTGNVFQLDRAEVIGGAVVLIATFAWGAWLMWRTWSTPSFTFLGGAALIAASCVAGYGLYGSQRDAA